MPDKTTRIRTSPFYKIRNGLPGGASAGIFFFLASSILFGQSPSSNKSVKPTPSRSQVARPNFSGIWRPVPQPQDFKNIKGPGMGAGMKNWGVVRTGGGFGFLDATMEEPVMLPWAQAKYNAFRKGAQQFMQPIILVEPWLNCLPSSFPWVYDAPDSPMEIVQTDKKLVMLFQVEGHWRQIFLDGRKNPEGAPDTFMGYSTGRWEGKTLVVETVGINDLTWIDRLGHPHSDALKVEERITRVAPDRMDIDFVFDDPKTYAKPWKGKKAFLAQKTDLVEMFACEDTWREQYPEKLRKEIGETPGP